MGAGWIEVVGTEADTTLFSDLDAGEASTLTLASEHTGPCLVVMEEALGRWHADARGLAFTGLAGVLIAARRAGIVDGVREYLDRLEKSDFRLSDAVIQAVLDQDEETSRSERA